MLSEAEAQGETEGGTLNLIRGSFEEVIPKVLLSICANKKSSHPINRMAAFVLVVWA
jgi:hypothetical protein